MPLNIGSTYTVMMKGLDGLRAAFEVSSLALVARDNITETDTSTFTTSLTPNSALIFGVIEVFYGTIGMIFLTGALISHLCVSRERGMKALEKDRMDAGTAPLRPEKIPMGLLRAPVPYKDEENGLFEAVAKHVPTDEKTLRKTVADYILNVTNKTGGLVKDQELNEDQIEIFINQQINSRLRLKLKSVSVAEYATAIEKNQGSLGNSVHYEVITRALQRPIIRVGLRGELLNRETAALFSDATPIFVSYDAKNDHYDLLKIDVDAGDEENKRKKSKEILIKLLASAPVNPALPIEFFNTTWTSWALFGNRSIGEYGRNQPFRELYQDYRKEVVSALLGGKQALRAISYVMSLIGSSLLLSSVENPNGLKAAVGVICIAISLFLTRVDKPTDTVTNTNLTQRGNIQEDGERRALLAGPH